MAELGRKIDVGGLSTGYVAGVVLIHVMCIGFLWHVNHGDVTKGFDPMYSRAFNWLMWAVLNGALVGIIVLVDATLWMHASVDLSSVGIAQTCWFRKRFIPWSEISEVQAEAGYLRGPTIVLRSKRMEIRVAPDFFRDADRFRRELEARIPEGIPGREYLRVRREKDADQG